MPPGAYLDECVNRHLTRLLRARGIDATTAFAAGTLSYDGESQLLFATRLGRIILTHNQRHFQRLHTRFVAEGRTHAGIMLIPNGPLALVALRAAMLIAWLDRFASAESLLIRWHDLQAELTQGVRLAGFSESEARQAIALDPIEP